MARKPRQRIIVSGYSGTGLRGQKNRGVFVTSRSNYSTAYSVQGRGRNKTYRNISNTAQGRAARQIAGRAVTSNRRYGAYGIVSRDMRTARRVYKSSGLKASRTRIGITTKRGMARRLRRTRRNYKGQFAGSY